MQAEELIAIVYRQKTGCRQYPFFSLDELRRWGSRYPYRDEMVRVLVIRNRRNVGEVLCTGPGAAGAVASRLERAMEQERQEQGAKV